MGLDFVSDSRKRSADQMPAVADDFTHECVQIATDFGMGASYVTRLLDEAAKFRGYPARFVPTTGRSSLREPFWPGRSSTRSSTC